MTSVFENGGNIGVDMDFNDDERYMLTGDAVSFVSGTSGDLNLTDTFAYPSGIQADDFIIAIQASDGADVSTPPTDSSSTEYNTLLQETDNFPNCTIWYKLADGTESGTNIVFTRSDGKGAMALQIFRGVDKNNPFDVSYTSDAGGSGDPDPPAITTVTDNAMVVILGALDDDTSLTYSLPSGYSNLNYAYASSPSGAACSVGMASKLIASAGEENPPVFTTSGDDCWHAVTIALRPVCTGNIKNSGIWSLKAVSDALALANEVRFIDSLFTLALRPAH